jgi:hypothetical protein
MDRIARVGRVGMREEMMRNGILDFMGTEHIFNSLDHFKLKLK